MSREPLFREAEVSTFRPRLDRNSSAIKSSFSRDLCVVCKNIYFIQSSEFWPVKMKVDFFSICMVLGSAVFVSARPQSTANSQATEGTACGSPDVGLYCIMFRSSY